MNAFSEKSFRKRLKDLNASQQSIQTLSLWLIHHRKNAKSAVSIWVKELQEATRDKKLTFLYLANDVVQNSKKKGPEFGQEFSPVIVRAFKDVASDVNDDKTISSMERIIKIWSERLVFSKEIIGGLQLAMVKGKQKQREKAIEDHNRKRKYTLDDVVYEVTGSPKEKDTLSDTEELLELLKKLQAAASLDAVTRKKIANLDPKVGDVKSLENISDKASADRLCKQVEDAYILVSEYNGRLEQEMEERNKLATLLPQFITSQKDEMRRLQDELQVYRGKLEQAKRIKKELDEHINSLPDMAAIQPLPLPPPLSVLGSQDVNTTPTADPPTPLKDDLLTDLITQVEGEGEEDSLIASLENTSQSAATSIGNLLPDDIDIDQFFD